MQTSVHIIFVLGREGYMAWTSRVLVWDVLMGHPGRKLNLMCFFLLEGCGAECTCSPCQVIKSSAFKVLKMCTNARRSTTCPYVNICHGSPSSIREPRVHQKILHQLETVNRTFPEYCWLSQLVSGMAPNHGPSVFPINLPTVLGDALGLSPNTVSSPIGSENGLE